MNPILLNAGDILRLFCEDTLEILRDPEVRFYSVWYDPIYRAANLTSEYAPGVNMMVTNGCIVGRYVKNTEGTGSRVGGVTNQRMALFISEFRKQLTVSKGQSDGTYLLWGLSEPEWQFVCETSHVETGN